MTSWIRRVVVLLRSRAWQLGVGAFCLLGVLLCGVSWWLTAPLEKTGVGSTALPPNTVTAAPAASGEHTGTPAEASPAQRQAIEPAAWPETRLEGRPAKELLLKMMQAVDRSFRLVHSYTMTFRKQERINGKLLPEQTYFLKVRQDPFAIYMRGIQPVAGRELIYAEGYYDNQVVGHPVGMARYLVPRLKVPPDHPMILAESRHPMNQAGLGNLIRKLLGFRQMDLEEPEEVTILDRTMTPDGKRWLRSTHIHPQFRPGRPLAQSEILYDPASRLPLRFTGFDWPADGNAEKPLGERYCYDDLDLDAVLSAKDFDPANPEYEFHHF
ncbi:MAG: DUF1571 domain-containing protein [Isosphaeraceae bacterium]